MNETNFKVNPEYLEYAKRIKKELSDLDGQLGLSDEQKEEFINMKTQNNHLIYFALLEYENRWVTDSTMEEAFPGILNQLFEDHGELKTVPWEGLDHTRFPFHRITAEEYERQEIVDHIQGELEDNMFNFIKTEYDERSVDNISDEVEININHNRQIEVDVSDWARGFAEEIDFVFKDGKNIGEFVYNILLEHGYKIVKVDPSEDGE